MKSVSLLNRLLNVGKNEWPRIVVAWSLQLFLRAGFVMGWTVTIAMFINRMGIETLPYLFVINALLVMLGTIIFSYLLKKIPHGLLIFYTTLMAIALLLLSTLFAYSNDIVFFGILILAQSILIAQLHILISLFTEDLFSPLESQRTFPLIATSETIGGIIGGLLVGTLSGFLPAYKFIYLWIIFISLIIPTLMTAHSYSKRTPSIRVHKHEKSKQKRGMAIPNLLKGIRKIRRVPFLQGIVLIVLLQFMMTYLFEFQYTKAIQEEVMAHEPPPISFEVRDYQPDSSLQVSLLDVNPIETNLAVAHQSETEMENKLTQKLGMLQVIFSAGSLLVQIFVTSRILNSLGIISTLLIHPLLTLINLVGMTLRFNFLSASIGRSNFEITTGIFRNTYHSSYYAIKENMRDQMKEIMEGFVKPFGAILAFGLLYLIQQAHSPQTETMIINTCMIGIAILMLLRSYKLHTDYTAISYQNIGNENDLPTRLNAIEILGQKGHEIKTELLVKYLHNNKETAQVKRHILKTLKLRNEPDSLADIIASLQDEHESVRLTALEILNTFPSLNSHVRNLTFTKHHAISTIKKLFLTERSSSIKAACIHLLAKFDDHELIPFIIETLQEGDEQVQRACIRACGTFRDRSIIHYIQDYLDHKNSALRGEAIVALWQFKKLRKTLSHYLEQMKENDKKECIMAAIYAVGKVGHRKDLAYLVKNLASSDQEIRKKAAYSIAELDHPAAIPHLVEFMIHEDHETSHKTKKFVNTLSQELVENVEHLVHIRVSEHINDVLEKSGAENLMELDIETLEKLRIAYATVDEHHEVHKIENLIKEKQKSNPNPAYETSA
jgi:HEAT repeat protein/MFS family permease